MEKAKARLAQLIEKYRAFIATADRREISEETVRTWLNAFLQIFGWEVGDTNQVLQERTLQGQMRDRLDSIHSTHRRPDYTLKNGPHIKSFLDAKALHVDIFKDKETAFQIRSYGWSAQAPCAFVSNFEQFVIYDCRFLPSIGQDASLGTIRLSIEQYLDRFDLLFSHLNREAVQTNALIRLYQTAQAEGRDLLDVHFMKVLSQFRLSLAREIAQTGQARGSETVNYYTQVILDRIVFIRVCESRGLETLCSLHACLSGKGGFWKCFQQSCLQEYRTHYGGAMFEPQPVLQKLELRNSVFETFIQKLYYPYPYRFDVIPVQVIAKIYEEFLGKSLALDDGEVKEVVKAEYLKTSGAVPTPAYLVELVCRQTILLEQVGTVRELLQIRVLDPCCGSGVFLIACFDVFAEALCRLLERDAQEAAQYAAFGSAGQDGTVKLTVEGRRSLLAHCLYGIDYDEAAVEVTKMALALKIIDIPRGMDLKAAGAFAAGILQGFADNIRLGNTLVAPDIPNAALLAAQVKPADLRLDKFPQVFAEKGGFDYVVGNPPYVETKHFKNAQPEVHAYLSQRYTCFEGKADLAVLFLERCLELLAQDGKLGFIVQRRWFKTKYGLAARRMIDTGRHLARLIDFQATDLFPRRTTYVSILVLGKQACETFAYTYLSGNAVQVQTMLEQKQEAITSEKLPNTGVCGEVWAYESHALLALKQTLGARWGSLSGYCGLHVKDGIQALWKKLYHLTGVRLYHGVATGVNGNGETVSVEADMVRAVIYNHVFYPFKQLSPDAYCIFPYQGESQQERIPIHMLRAQYPLLYAYLCAHEQDIRAHVRVRQEQAYWHAFTREHNHASYMLDKIILPMTAKDTIAAYAAGQGLYMDNANVWFITVQDASASIMKALTAFLNSTVFSVLAKAGANPQSGGYYKFNRQFLDPVPFPSAAFVPDSPLVARLEVLHDSLAQLQEQYLHCIPAQREVFGGMLRAQWDELDGLCETLYGLTEQQRQSVRAAGRTVDRIALLDGAK